MKTTAQRARDISESGILMTRRFAGLRLVCAALVLSWADIRTIAGDEDVAEPASSAGHEGFQDAGIPIQDSPHARWRFSRFLEWAERDATIAFVFLWYGDDDAFAAVVSHLHDKGVDLQELQFGSISRAYLPSVGSASEWGLMHVAATRNCPASVRLLLQMGVKVDGRDGSTAWTPLELLTRNGSHVAGAYGSSEEYRAMLELLIRAGADVSNPVVLSHVIAMQDTRLIKLVLDLGADPNRRTRTGGLPLIDAAHTGRRDIVDLLLRAGADLDLEHGSVMGFTPRVALEVWEQRGGLTNAPGATSGEMNGKGPPP